MAFDRTGFRAGSQFGAHDVVVSFDAMLASEFKMEFLPAATIRFERSLDILGSTEIGRALCCHDALTSPILQDECANSRKITAATGVGSSLAFLCHAEHFDGRRDPIPTLLLHAQTHFEETG